MMLRLCAVLMALAAAGPAAAQGPQPAAPGPLGLVQGDSKDQPVQIEAASLEVRDKNKTATFSGHVEVVQGDGAELAMLELVGSELVKRAAERAKRKEERLKAQQEGR